MRCLFDFQFRMLIDACIHGVGCKSALQPSLLWRCDGHQRGSTPTCGRHRYDWTNPRQLTLSAAQCNPSVPPKCAAQVCHPSVPPKCATQVRSPSAVYNLQQGGFTCSISTVRYLLFGAASMNDQVVVSSSSLL